MDLFLQKKQLRHSTLYAIMRLRYYRTYLYSSSRGFEVGYRMGKIDNAVQYGILKKKPELTRILAPFLNDFDISWGAERVAFNTTLDVFIIKPSGNFAEQFGLEYELLMVHTPYESMQARTMQAINAIFNSDPAKGRVETLVCIVVSKAPDAREWVNTYATENQDLRTYVVFNTDNLLQKTASSLISGFRSQLGERDLFDIQLPLLDDLYFFGRQTILQTIVGHIKQCENCGIFGLRKTGKTSLLYKIQRTVESANIGKVLIYDAKNAKIRMRAWTELLLLIVNGICNAYGLTIPKVPKDDNLAIVESFEEILRSIPSQQRVVVIIDEIEYISFNPPLDSHWKREYLDFWQCLWSMQSSFRNICFVIAGVNPQVVEVSSINTVQNPLFAIIKPYHILGLNRQDIHEMSRRIGRRLGLRFNHTAIDYIYARYSGHPLLTRLVLSYENQNAPHKPISFTEEELISHETAREEALIPYCQHIVDVLKDFYPEEYVLLSLLSVRDFQGFLHQATEPMMVKHLKNYGLLIYKDNKPQIGIPVMASYIQSVVAKKQGTQMGRTIIPPEQRETWLANGVKSIISYMRQLEIAIRVSGTASLFGSNSFPEADKLLVVPVAHSENDFKAFISTFSNCFVESIGNYGKSIHKSNYFWEDIQRTYHLLFDALLRVKAYRNWCEHLQLTSEMQKHVNRYLYADLEGKRFCDVHEPWFILQQCVLDELKVAISLEISNLS